jgi:hypothetical protein
MRLASWIRSFSATILPGGSANTKVFLDEKRFRFELARERMRVDRSHSPLAVLTIELPADRSTPDDYDFLGRLLMRRLRITDTFGFLSDQRVGVLLPDTSKSGAWKVADDLCSVYPVGHDRPSCDVLVYPDEAPRRDGTHRDHPKESTPSAIDALLAQASPPWKRVIDVIGAAVGLTLSAPLLLLICTLIKLTSRGPAIYSQEREGLGGRRFRIYKLRTMRLNAENLQALLREYSEQDGPAFYAGTCRSSVPGRFPRTSRSNVSPGNDSDCG